MSKISSGQQTSCNNKMEHQDCSAEIPPARDGNIAIREEYDAAMAANTVAAFEIFIARHPDHTLANLARDKLAQLQCDDC